MVAEDGASAIPGDIRLISDIDDPVLHKSMLILLSRTFDYKVSGDSCRHQGHRGVTRAPD